MNPWMEVLYTTGEKAHLEFLDTCRYRCAESISSLLEIFIWHLITVLNEAFKSVFENVSPT